MASGIQRRPRSGAILVAAAVSALTACTTDPAPTASGNTDGTSIVIAAQGEPASLNPLAGYAPHGAAKLYDGLLEHQADLALRPALATALPKPSADGRSWTISVRSGIVFSDGSLLDAGDVVATYRAVITPGFAAPVRSRFGMLKSVHQVDSSTVQFDLSRPYAPFPELLTLGVLPVESLATPAPVTGGRRDRPPPGTGPYRLVSWQPGQRMELAANRNYYGGRPAIDKVTIEFEPSDTARVQQARAGTVDATTLPCTSSAGFADTDDFDLVTEQHTAELRAVVLPTKDPVAGDPAVRRALNLAVDRASMVTKALDGKGTAAYTPMPAAAAEFVEPNAKFPHDPAAAEQLLDQAGWARGGDGVRARGTVQAELTVRYPKGDDEASALITEFTADARAIGIKVVGQQVDPDTVTTGGGPALLRTGTPFDPDLDLYPLLHSPGKPGGYANQAVDAALETGRTATDPAQRSAAYRQLQRAYLTAPGMVTLVSPYHCYLVRRSWNGYQPVADGAQADITWGPWWNLPKWTPR